MSLDNFRNRAIVWDTVNKDFPQPIQIMQGDVNARTLSVKILDNGGEIDLTGHSLKLTYQYTNSSNSGFVMIPPENLTKGEFILVIPTEMTKPGVIEANLILLNEDKEQVIVSKKLTFISDNSTVTVLAQEVNNKIDDFTKLLLENMPQVMRSELNDLHAQTESNKSNIELKANLADMTSLQSAMTELKNEVEAFGISPKNLVTIKSLLDAIASNASESEVVELINSVKALTSNISLMSNGDYSPKAKLATPRKLGVNLQSSSFQEFDGTADATNIGVSGVLPIANGGTSTSDGVINTIAYANSADGTDDFTTVYPNLNLLVNSSAKTKDGFFKNFDKVEDGYGEVTMKGTNTSDGRDLSDGFLLKPRDYKPGDKYTISVDIMFTSWNLPAGTTLTEFWFGQRYLDPIWKPICSIDLPKDPSRMMNKWIRITQTSTIPPYQDPSVNTQAVFQAQFSGVSGGSFTVRVRKPKQEPGSIATPWMPNKNEVTINDYPKYVGFSNIIKPNKKSSDYKWLPMWLASIDRATGLLKPAVMGIDYAQAHPVGSVVTNSSNSSSGYTTGTWENIGSTVIGSTTVYYWKRTT